MKKFLGFGMLVLALYGCTPVDTYDGGPVEPTPGPVDLAVQTIEWVDDVDGNSQFYTNDRTYCGLYGSTVFHLTNSSTPMGSVVTEADKRSGSGAYGYGIVFCVQENVGVTDPAKKYNFYTVNIFTDRNYRIAKRFAGEWYTIQEKTACDRLYEVTVSTNTIKVTYDAGGFVLSFNGHEEAGETISFTDNTGTAPITGGYFGYIVEIGRDESFPNTPVDVRFRQVTP